MTTSALRELARSHGVQLSFRDVTGTVRRAPTETLLAIVNALDPRVRTPDDAPRVLREVRRRAASRARPAAHRRRSRVPRPSGKPWGTFLPLYAVRGDRDAPVADLSTLETLVGWTAKLGGTFVGTLPLYASFLDEPFDPSPYSPVSKLFFNELYVDVERSPEFEANTDARRLVGSRAFQAEGRALASEDLVDHRGAYSNRRRALELLAATRTGDLDRRMRAFRAHEPRIDDYASFRAQREPGDRRANERFHRYAQLIVHEQLSAVAASEAGRGLHLDLPVGVHGDGYDVHAFPDAFVRGMSVGAPPDAFFRGGQNWGFPPLHPRLGVGYFETTIRKLASLSSVMRIDHIMGLARSYWIPDGFPATDGAYVRMPSEQLFSTVAREAVAAGTIVVGEDLGTVPRSVPALMRRYGILSTYVLQFSLTDDDRHPVVTPRRDQLACLNTHDLAPFAAFWTDLPVDRRRAVTRWLDISERSRPPDVARALLTWLAGSDAAVVLVNLEDLWGERRPQNEPGTTTQERPNWSRRTAKSLEEIVRDEHVLRTLGSLQRARDGGAHG